MKTKKIKTLGIFKPTVPDETLGKKSKIWPLDRIEELIVLAELLDNASMLNNGSGVLERMRKVIDAASRLQKSDINTVRPSFFQFLIEVRARDEGRE